MNLMKAQNKFVLPALQYSIKVFYYSLVSLEILLFLRYGVERADARNLADCKTSNSCQC